MKEIKLGMVGTNFVSDWMAETAEKTDGITAAAVYSRTLEKGGEFAKKHSIPKVYTDYGKMLSSDIDAVYIANPNKFHFDFAMRAVEFGKHVLLEKPATLTQAEYKRLLGAADEHNVVVMEAIRPIHDPLLETVRENLALVEPVRHAVLEFCQYSSRYDKFKCGIVENAFTPSLGNAAVMDIGVYALHVARYLFGMPERIVSMSQKLSGGMEGAGTVLLSYGGFTATVIYSKVNDSVNSSCISGERGALKIGKLSTVESAELVLRGGEKKILGENREENNMIYLLADFVSSIRGERKADVYNRLTSDVLGMIDVIREQNEIIF